MTAASGLQRRLRAQAEHHLRVAAVFQLAVEVSLEREEHPFFDT